MAEIKPPVAEAGGPYRGVPGVEVDFDGSASDDQDGEVEFWFWDFGDGGFGIGETTSHTYADTTRIYDVILTVIDDDGQSSMDSTHAIIGSVPNEPPVAEAGGPYPGVPGVDVEFDGSASDDPGRRRRVLVLGLRRWRLRYRGNHQPRL